jgi:hypothetical protein
MQTVSHTSHATLNSEITFDRNFIPLHASLQINQSKSSNAIRYNQFQSSYNQIFSFHVSPLSGHSQGYPIGLFITVGKLLIIISLHII